MAQYRVVSWDHRAQPDIAAFNEALMYFYLRDKTPLLTAVEETGDDQYAVVIAPRIVPQAEAREMYETWVEE